MLASLLVISVPERYTGIPVGQKWTDLKNRDDIMNLFGSTHITSYTISSKQSNLSLDILK